MGASVWLIWFLGLVITGSARYILGVRRCEIGAPNARRCETLSGSKKVGALLLVPQQIPEHSNFRLEDHSCENQVDEMTGPRRDGVGSKLSAYSKAQEIKQTGSEKVTRLAQLVGGADAKFWSQSGERLEDSPHFAIRGSSNATVALLAYSESG